MKTISKIMLAAVTFIAPVFIAACYGMMYAFSKAGKVLDAETGEGIEGIKVSCLVGDEEIAVDYTYGGQFYLDMDEQCEFIAFTDEDGEENGGQYASLVIPYCEECGDVLVKLNKEQ